VTPPGLLTLSSGQLELRLAPQAGGAIACFDWLGQSGRIPVLRGAEGIPGKVLDAASFPLVPFVNRVRGGRFEFRGREIRLAPNMAGDPNPLHGQGWLAAWKVEASSGRQALLSFRHEAGEWPWDYEAEQHFRLDDKGLSVRLSCRNMSNEPMPCGLGQHPYFPCTPETRLDTEVTHVWTIDEHVLPVEKVPATGRYDLRNRAVCGQDLDRSAGPSLLDPDIVARRGLFPALLARRRRAVRRRAGDPRQCRDERARAGMAGAWPGGAGAGRGNGARHAAGRHR
jgi:aldose 1-epimerase